MSVEEHKTSQEQFSIDSLDEIVSRARIMKEEIEVIIKHKRIKPEDIHPTLLNWFTKVMQLIRRCLTERQFETLLTLSHPELELA